MRRCDIRMGVQLRIKINGISEKVEVTLCKKDISEEKLSLK